MRLQPTAIGSASPRRSEQWLDSAGRPVNSPLSHDHVTRAGRTFRYTAEGPEGLLKGKRAILVLSRGGVYTKGPMLRFEFQESYLRGVLGFLGITDVRVIRIEGMAMGADVAAAAVARALAEADVIALDDAPAALAA